MKATTIKSTGRKRKILIAMGFLKTSENVPLEMLEYLDVPFYGIWGKEDT